MRSFSFEKSDVWQKFRELTKAVYSISGNFPIEERYRLTSQIRRAVISISSNISGGTSQHSSKDKAKFTEMSYGSLMEVLNQLIATSDLEFITDEKVVEDRPLIEEIGNKLNTLYNYQVNNK